MLLLDTCALIWMAEGTMGLLSRAGRTSFTPDAKTWFATILGLARLRLAPITPAIAIDASQLPGPLLDDAADRLIIATARHLAAGIVTGTGACSSTPKADTSACLPVEILVLDVDARGKAAVT